jgi:hypothetical protein
MKKRNRLGEPGVDMTNKDVKGTGPHHIKCVELTRTKG